MSPESIRRLQSEDPDEWKRVFDEYLPRLLLYFACRTTDRVESCDDLAQDTLVRVMRAIRSFDPEDHARFDQWVFKIGRNCLIDSVRRAQRSVKYDTRYSIERGATVEAPPELRGHPDWRDLRDDLRDALAKLPPKQRQAVFLKHCVGMSTEHVSREMNIEPGTVSQHLHKGMLALRAGLGAPMPRSPGKGGRG